MSNEDIDKRVRELELSEGTLKQRVHELEDKLGKVVDTHKAQCPFMIYKEDLFEKIKEIKEWTEEEFESTETVIEHVEEKLGKRIDDQRTLFFWINGGIASVFILIISLLFAMNTDKVSTQTFGDTINKLTVVQEKQAEISNKILLDVGIIKAKLEEHDYRDRGPTLTFKAPTHD